MITLQSRLSKRNRFGFTLIEMMLVVCIIAILLAIAIPSYLSARSRSQASVCRGQLRQLQDAKDRWAIDNRKVSADTASMDDLVPTYIKDVPECPANGEYDLGSIGDNPTCTVSGHTLY